MTYPTVQHESFNQEQLTDLLMQGMQYQKLNKHQQQENCKKLKQDEEKLWLMRQLDFLPKNLVPPLLKATLINDSSSPISLTLSKLL